jgi:hypothetical protein
MANAWSGTAAGGTSDSQPSGSERVRSKPQKATSYDPAMSIAKDFAKRAALQTQNADRIEVEREVLAWCEGQVSAWKAHTTMSKSDSGIPLDRWLELNYAAEKAGIGQYGGSASFLETLDQQRAKRTKDSMDETDARRAALEIPKVKPSEIQTGPLSTSIPSDDQPQFMRAGSNAAAIQRFKSEHGGSSAALEAWCRSQLRNYREYLRAFSTKSLSPRLTPEEWLKTNFRSVRGGNR